MLLGADFGVLVVGCCWVPVAGLLTPSLSLAPLFSGCTAQAEGAKEATPSPGSSQSESELQEGGGANVEGKEIPGPPPALAGCPHVPVSPGGLGPRFPATGTPLCPWRGAVSSEGTRDLGGGDGVTQGVLSLGGEGTPPCPQGLSP